MKKELKLADIFVTYEPDIDTALYVIQNNLEDYKFAIVENFIDTVFHLKEENVSFFYGYSFMSFDCFIYNRLIPDFSNLFIKDFSELIKLSIDRGYYVVYVPDIYYINEYKFKKHMIHPMLIYGYNMLEKKFLVRDYFDFIKPTDKYILTQKFNEVFKYPSKETYMNYIHCLKLDPFKKRQINIEVVIKKLKEFLDNKTLGYKENKYYGIIFLDILEQQLITTKSLKDLKLKKYYFIYVHIKLMIERIKLIEKEYNINLNVSKIKLNFLIDKSILLKNKLIKIVIISADNDTVMKVSIKSCIDIICLIKKEYKQIIEQIIDDLEKIPVIGS